MGTYVCHEMQTVRMIGYNLMFQLPFSHTHAHKRTCTTTWVSLYALISLHKGGMKGKRIASLNN